MLHIFKSESGKIIISIILGFGLASLFQKVCKDRKCIVYKAPNMNKITQNTYGVDGECMKFVAEPSRCNKNPLSS